MTGLPAKLADLLETLSLVPDRQDRIQLLIDIAERYRGVPDTVARRPYPESHKVPACESEAFLWAETQDDGTLRFHFAVENPQGISAKALAVILDDTCSGADPEQVSGLPGEIVYEIFGRELSMGKTMGLTSMVGMVRASAKKALG